MGITDDPTDPRLTRGVDDEPTDQAEVYLVLSEEERAKGFIRPVRDKYIHASDLGGCGLVTTMGLALAETYAAKPDFYSATFCVHCSKHLPVTQFRWIGFGGGSIVGT